ncbi:outer membrane protein assembly factor BamB family protein [Flavobacterium granuli]|uniref:PQQ-like domain-containing protein n=1 Tax=Flavobacterium granuli TaxID=280093 RepID=A0A1M5NJV4_9FLAO|nr:PQQ-binding-like beta-propeller repeat protein [Flavobacterium granuli]PRZ23306.1 putative pyrroloquinoline-quinone binding quinoprotein [Flavobacterium granuli]SHG89725.1 PQQ-like domain-containing protein [Flavobacterium granuli]
MVKKSLSFFPLHCCFLLVSLTVFAQTAVYKSNFVFKDFQVQEPYGSLLISGNKILFNAGNYKIYAIAKDSLKPIWETDIVSKSNAPPYLHKNTFIYSNYEKGTTTIAQYDLDTGEIIKNLSLKTINSKPYFANNTMYCTAVTDGGKLVAYHLEDNKIIWQKNIGQGVDFQPAYLKDKIIANAEDDNWFAIDYNGNFLETRSKKRTSIDSTQFFVRNYKFLTHDGREITQDFLTKNQLANAEYQTRTSDSHTFILAENQLLVLGNNRKKVLQLDLETAFPTDNFAYDAYSSILETRTESAWFCYQNYLIHYDFAKKKLLRKIDLTRWNPHQVELDNRTIWLISKNDGLLYGLDFEPDQKTADFIKAKAEMQREIHNPKPPDKKRIEAAKAAEEKFKNKNN